MNKNKLTWLGDSVNQEVEQVNDLQLQFDMQDNPEKHNELKDVDLYDWRDLDDKWKQLYWLRKSVIRVCRTKNFTNRAARMYADRYTLPIYEALAANKE